MSSFLRKIQKEKGSGFAFKSAGDCPNEPFIKQYPRGFNDGWEYDVCPAITTSGWQNNNFLVEPNVLTPKRTEYGKKMRKAYENGDFKESRHNMTLLEPRKDGICNTITTVQKDNLLYEPINNRYFRIRKLTAKECFRLMDVSDNDIEKIQRAGICKTQQYKMAGNSIAVSVLYYIFKNLFNL